MPMWKLLLAAIPALAASAQAPRDSAACREMLSAPPPDSAVTRIALTVRPFDSALVHMTAAYRELVATSVRQLFKPPQVLGLRTYGQGVVLPGKRSPAYQTMMLQATYRATLRRDGRLSGVRVTGGTRDAEFDAAMLRAIQAVSDSSLLVPAVAPAVVFEGDSLALQFQVAADELILPPRFTPDTASPSRATPLLRIRTPIRQVTQPVGVRDARRPPEYPLSMRAKRAEGRTTLDFVIDASGQPDLSTVQIVATPSVEFVASILEVLPLHHFKPLMLDGCAVAVVVREAFEFHFTP